MHSISELLVELNSDDEPLTKKSEENTVSDGVESRETALSLMPFGPSTYSVVNVTFVPRVVLIGLPFEISAANSRISFVSEVARTDIEIGGLFSTRGD